MTARTLSTVIVEVCLVPSTLFGGLWHFYSGCLRPVQASSVRAFQGEIARDVLYDAHLDVVGNRSGHAYYVWVVVLVDLSGLSDGRLIYGRVDKWYH